jgi:signal transduction histidine kinase
MGRLFWKFFLLVGLVQVIAVIGVGASFVYLPGPHPPPPPPSEPGGPAFHAVPGAAHGAAAARAGAHAPGASAEAFLVNIPPNPVIGAVVASILSAALLAWYLAKPIRSLKAAFAAAAAGDLGVRVGRTMGRGKDEMTDLGREFDRMVERLDALVTGQQRLLHDVSHEMRSPLARIQAALGLAAQQPDHSAEAMARIDGESVRMDRLIGELLALARLQAGFVGPMNEEVDLQELIGLIVDDARFEATNRGRSVIVERTSEAWVRGDARLLRRAIENVVRNAIKYSPDGGSVRICAYEDADREAIVITVGDQGPGVPEQDLGVIFDPFYRSASGQKQDGHGLGLAIARRIVEAHGGSIAARNLPAGGLGIEMLLPPAGGLRAFSARARGARRG